MPEYGKAQAVKPLSLQVFEWQRTHDEALFENIYAESVDRFKSAAAKMCGNNSYLFDELCDLAPSLIEKLSNQYTGERGCEFASYLTGGMRNTLFDLQRRQRVRSKHVTKTAKNNASWYYDPQEQIPEYKELVCIVERSVETLTPRNRKLWDMYMKNPDSPAPYAELARALGTTVESVRGKLHRVREKLKQDLETYLDAA